MSAARPIALASTLAAAVAAAGLLGSGYSSDPPDAAPSQTEDPMPTSADAMPRFVSRFGGWKRNWLPEASTPIVPQSAPMMLIYEVSQYGRGEKPTPAQLTAADILESRVRRAAQEHGWYDYEKGLEDRFALMFGDEVHYANREYVLDDRILDADRPEFLMYYDTEAGKRLVGFMFYTRSMEERGPQVGGPLTVWHYHTWNRSICLVGGLLASALPDPQGRCAAGTPSRRSPEMIHVWLIDHPLGRFTTTMKLPAQMVEELTKKPDYVKLVEASAG